MERVGDRLPDTEATEGRESRLLPLPLYVYSVQLRKPGRRIQVMTGYHPHLRHPKTASQSVPS
jgi:hypothetical protein